MASRSERRQNSGENDVGDVGRPSPAATLTDEMRRASKDMHDTSDRLVNVKLGLVLTSPGLYGEALALFYPIFAKIEDIIELHKGHEQIGKMYPLLELMRRAPGFRKDMEYYLTSDRRTELEQMVQRGENSVMEEFYKTWTGYQRKIQFSSWLTFITNMLASSREAKSSDGLCRRPLGCPRIRMMECSAFA